MAASYKTLFKLFTNREMKSKELAKMVGISPATLSKMKKDGASDFVQRYHCRVRTAEVGAQRYPIDKTERDPKL